MKVKDSVGWVVEVMGSPSLSSVNAREAEFVRDKADRSGFIARSFQTMFVSLNVGA